MKAEGKMAKLFESCVSGNLPRARKQLQRGEDVNYRNYNDGTCLEQAVRSQNKELVLLLLEQPGIDVHVKNFRNATVLHRAAGPFGTPAILRLLLNSQELTGKPRIRLDGLP